MQEVIFSLDILLDETILLWDHTINNFDLHQRCKVEYFIKNTRRLQMPKYRLLQVPVQRSEETDPFIMPENMFFYIDTRFTKKQEQRIRLALMSITFYHRDYYDQLDNKGISDFAECANLYSKFNLSPVWSNDKYANGRAATHLLMDGLGSAISANGFKRTPNKAYIMYPIDPKTATFSIQAKNASDPEVNSLTVTVNPKFIDRNDINDAVVVGSLFHAWMHRLGYRHPASKYHGYFSVETAICVMVANGLIGTPRPPRSKFNVYHQFID